MSQKKSNQSIGQDVHAFHEGDKHAFDNIPYDPTAGKFDPHSTKMEEDVLTKFLHNPLTGDLSEVPGIGDKNKEHFMNLNKETEGKFHNVMNSWQLMGVYMRLKEDNMTGADLCNKFWHWLKVVGINSGRNHIVRSIAEKCHLVEGYDPSNYKHSAKVDEERLAGIAASTSA